MILHYYGIDASEEDIGRVAKTTVEHGTTNDNLLIAARSYGLDGVWHKEATLADLCTHVAQNIPVIVEWFSTNQVHYSIVVGADEDQIVLLNPEHGEQESFTHEEFMSVWFSFSGPFIKTQRDVQLRWMLPLTKAR